MIDAQEDSPINSALRQFEATEANLAKLEQIWSEIVKLTPQGLAFGNDAAHEEHVRVYEDVLGALPKIDGWKPESVPMDLNSIGQNRLDAKEIGEISGGCRRRPNRGSWPRACRVPASVKQET